MGAFSDVILPDVILSDVLLSDVLEEIASTFGVAPSSRKASRCARLSYVACGGLS